MPELGLSAARQMATVTARARSKQKRDRLRNQPDSELFNADAPSCKSLALHLEQFDFEDQRGIRRYHAACPASAIAQLWRDDERALATDLHRGDTFVPAGNDPLSADRKLEGSAAVERAV